MFIKPSVVKKYVSSKGKRTAKSFISSLDAFIQHKIDQCIAQHNGNKKTLDAELAAILGIK